MTHILVPPRRSWRPDEEYRRQIRRDIEAEMAQAIRLDCQRSGLPLPIGGGTTFSGFETLMSMEASSGTVGPTASLLSVLTRKCVQPIAPSYFSDNGQRLWVRAYGTISTTATVPTYQLQFVVGPAGANPIASANMLAQNATITPAASTSGNLEWWLDLMAVVRAPGSAGTMLAVGRLTNDWAAAGTYVTTPFKNATPPTAVSVTGGMAVPLYFDLEVIMGAATAGNTITCLDYQLASMN